MTSCFQFARVCRIAAARRACPDAFVVYKPHPDVLSGNRRGKLALAAARAWAAAQHPALAGAGPLLLLPGRGTRLKGHHDAIALLARLQGAGIEARLWMPGTREAGREAYLLELEAEARRAGCAQALVITPPTPDIARAYAASDLVLQLSRKPEAFGRTVIESLSVGRPVVGWAHGGVGELLAGLLDAPLDARRPAGRNRPAHH